MTNNKTVVINEELATQHLQSIYPSIKNEITQLSSQNNFAGIIQATVNEIKILLQESKVCIVNRNIKMMDWLYRNGTQNVQLLIENLFVRSFNSFKKQSDVQQWQFLYQYMPVKFQEIYVKQTRVDEILFKKK
ncbi:hypothetical protein [Chryseobacterium sp.]|uniref:DUF7674 family protein n=1 Tax=Chryseobacterium sp. TaxID=1871047 RepID=UPI00388D8116